MQSNILIKGFIGATLGAMLSVAPAQTQELRVTQIAAGGAHTCALDGDGRVWCRGRNTFGELGDGTKTERLAPVLVQGLRNVAQIALGTYHSCARLTNGRVRC